MLSLKSPAHVERGVAIKRAGKIGCIDLHEKTELVSRGEDELYRKSSGRAGDERRFGLSGKNGSENIQCHGKEKLEC